MCEDPIQAERSSMVSTSESHQSQELQVPSPDQPSPDQPPSPGHQPPPSPGLGNAVPKPGTPGSGPVGSGPVGSGPVNAITVLTLLDKLVNMLDTVQENQHNMEGRQAEMEGAVRGIQADMTKLSKSHTHTSNTVSKLLDKSRKVSVTMKEVRDRMERQAGQVKKLEANHAHLLKRNHFKVLIFQEENEIPSSVFVKEPVPFPREQEGEESVVVDGNRSLEEEGLHTIELSSDEEAGLEGEGLEDDGLDDLHDLGGDHLEKTRAEKIKSSSLKKVDSLKRAFSRQNIEKKMNKIVSQEKRDKIKKSLTPKNNPKSPGTKSSFKVSPLTFSLRKSKPSETPEASPQTGDFPAAEPTIELSPVGSPDEELSFPEVHSQLAPELDEEAKAAADALEKEEPTIAPAESNGIPDANVPESNGDIPEVVVSVSEGLSEEYALSATLPQDDYPMSKSPFTQEEMEEDDYPMSKSPFTQEEMQEEEREEQQVVEKPKVEVEKEEVKKVEEQKEEEQKEEKEKEEERKSPVEKAEPEAVAS